MRRGSWVAVGLAGLSLVQSGCLLARNVAHNLVNETAEHWDQRNLNKQFRSQAREAWAAYCLQSGGAFSAEFADGFQDGYADYLDAGGPGVPPAVAPPQYRRQKYLSPEGHALVQDWFAGFKAGQDLAHASGRRQFLTVPVLLSGDSAPPSYLPGTQVPTNSPVLNSENLPAPRQMDPTTGLPIPNRPLLEGLPLKEKEKAVAPPKLELPIPKVDPLQPKIPEAPQSRQNAPANPVVPASAESIPMRVKDSPLLEVPQRSKVGPPPLATPDTRRLIERN